jgi:pimeloyl-ACP methyl ester carboxylesterase
MSRPREDGQQMLKRITCPVLLATANVESGGLVTDAVAEEAARLCKTLVRTHFDQAGHSIHRDQFYAFRDAVRTFLRRLKP